MSSFFSVSITICLFMLGFVLVGNLVVAIVPDAFPNPGVVSHGEGDFSSVSGAVSFITNSDDTTLNDLWMFSTVVATIGAFALAFFTHSIVPLGIVFYGTTFWTLYIRLMNMIGGYGSFISSDLIVVFSVGLVFVFVASIIGMITGSG